MTEKDKSARDKGPSARDKGPCFTFVNGPISNHLNNLENRGKR